jgi:parallel beta-helix repeat protein
LLAIPTLVHGQTNRTFISGDGSDANAATNCLRTNPCRTFGGAYPVTNAGGEIVALNTAGFGAVGTINKSITLEAIPGQHAYVAGNGFYINAGPGDVVVLRNITLNGVGGGQNAIEFYGGSALHLENCDITGWSGGIFFAPTSTSGAQLFMNDTRVSSCGGIDLTGAFGGGVFVKGSLNNVNLDKNSDGLVLLAGARATIRNSVISGSANVGLYCVSNTQLSVEDCQVSNNLYGIVVTESATIRVANSVITNNTTGLLTQSPTSQILSRATGDLANPVFTNTLEGNGTDGAFTGMYSAK